MQRAKQRVDEVVQQERVKESAREQHQVKLETFLDTNVPFYKRNGFDLIAEGVEPTSKCRYWTFLSRKR